MAYIPNLTSLPPCIIGAFNAQGDFFISMNLSEHAFKSTATNIKARYCIFFMLGKAPFLSVFCHQIFDRCY
ncbi:hypothetical protein HpHA187_14530 [Helicobacter pylori]